MVEIARALAHEARIVVMDEPTSSLTPNEVALLFAVIRRLTALGIAVLYVSHKLDEVFEIADTVTVLRDGRHISTKPIAEHTNDTLIQDMIGRRIENLFPRQRGAAGRGRAVGRGPVDRRQAARHQLRGARPARCSASSA